MGLTHTHLLGADLCGNGVDHVALDGEEQVYGALIHRNFQGAVSGIHRHGLLMGPRLHRNHLAIQHLAGGHQLAGDVFLDIVVDLLLHTLDQHGIGYLGLAGIDAAAPVLAQELHAQHHYGHKDHQNHQQIHNVELAKQSSLFVYHLL